MVIGLSCSATPGNASTDYAYNAAVEEWSAAAGGQESGVEAVLARYVHNVDWVHVVSTLVPGILLNLGLLLEQQWRLPLASQGLRPALTLLMFSANGECASSSHAMAVACFR